MIIIFFLFKVLDYFSVCTCTEMGTAEVTMK